MGANEIIALCALIMSAVSISLTIHFSRLQVKHFRNSVHPIAQIVLGDYENLLFVEVRNYGVGPLLISRLFAKSGGTDYSRLIDLFDSVDQEWVDFVEKVDGMTIPVGGTIVLAKIQPKSEQIRTKVRSILSKVTIVVDYTDIYGQMFHTERNLSFFGRTLCNNTELLETEHVKNVNKKDRR